MTRLQKETAVRIPSETFMGAEIWSWHQPLAIQEFQGKTKKPIRIAYFCDSHAAVTSEENIQQQCAPPAAPGIGPVPRGILVRLFTSLCLIGLIALIGCGQRKGKVKGKAPKGEPSSVLAIRAGD